jgi:hypothetical protein
MRRPGLALFVSAVSAAVAFASAVQLIGEVRLVHVIMLFFGGFGSGAGLVRALAARRAARRPDRRS